MHESALLAWQTFDWPTAVLVFLAYVLIDGMYAFYTMAVTNKKAVSAATVGSLMHFLIALGVLSYVENYLYLLPLAAGSWLGTYLVVRAQS